MKLFISKEKGFSLVEVMVVAAILGGLALVTMNLVNTQTTSTANMKAKMDEIEIRRLMTLTLSDGNACKNTFNGKNVGQSITKVLNSGGGDAYVVNQTYGEGNTKITSMTTQDLGSIVGSLRDVDLVVGTTRTVMGKAKTDQFRIRLKIKAANATAAITDCFVDTQAAVDMANAATCSSLGGTWTAATSSCDLTNYVKKAGDTMTGNLVAPNFCTGANCKSVNQLTASWTSCGTNQVSRGIKADGTQDCVAAPPISDCGSGSALQGYDASGNPICTNQFDMNCSGGWSTCSVSCGTGGTQTYTVYYAATGAGAPCSNNTGDVRACSPTPPACPVNCAGSWGSCTGTCGTNNATETFTITTPAANGGTACAYSNGATRACTRPCNSCASANFTHATFGTCGIAAGTHGQVKNCTVSGTLVKNCSGSTYCGSSGGGNSSVTYYRSTVCPTPTSPYSTASTCTTTCPGVNTTTCTWSGSSTFTKTCNDGNWQ